MNEVVLRDLQSVLRQELGDDLIVVNFTTQLLLPPGENYGSTMLAVVAEIKKNNVNTNRIETLNLVAKMLPPTDFQRKIFDSGFTFRKECFLYTDILPRYKKLEIEFGVKEEDIFDIGAKFYGAKIASSPDIDFDDDAVILLENLKVRGYYTGDRKSGLDLEHSRMAIKAMAKFHALGMAVKYKYPEEFAKLKERCKCLKLNPEAFEGMKDSFLDLIRRDSVMGKYIDKITPLLDDNTDNWTGTPEEPWSTIIHADFWVNNMMFHKNSHEPESVDDVKFVDFQNYLFQNPLNELIFFIGASIQTDLILDNLDDILNLYYDSFIEVMMRMDCDTSQFTRANFHERINKGAHTEFSHCAIILKILTIDIETDGVEATKLDSLEFGIANKRFYDRIRQLLLIFIERNWI